MIEKDASDTAGGRSGLPATDAASSGPAARESGQELRGATSEGSAPAPPASGAQMSASEALYWLERRAAVQRHERTSTTRNRWTLRDIAAVEAVVATIDLIGGSACSE